MARYWLDPSEGWRFGFPKEFEGDVDTLDINQWLGENGYPQEQIDLYDGNVRCRIVGPLDPL